MNHRPTPLPASRLGLTAASASGPPPPQSQPPTVSDTLHVSLLEVVVALAISPDITLPPATDSSSSSGCDYAIQLHACDLPFNRGRRGSIKEYAIQLEERRRNGHPNALSQRIGNREAVI